MRSLISILVLLVGVPYLTSGPSAGSLRYAVFGGILTTLGSPQQTGTVTGTVKAANGVPVPGIRVTAIPVGTTDDRLRAMSSLTITDDNGRYRLENVPAGRYHIGVGRVDLPTYYPGTEDVSRASIVSVMSAATVSDIDVVVQDLSLLPPAQPGIRGGRGAVGPAPAGRGRPLPAIPPTPLQIQPFNPFFTPQVLGVRGRATAPALNRAVIRDALNSPTAAWWTNTALVSRLGLTDDQRKRIEATFEQYRQTLMQNTTDLEREEGSLARMLESEPLDSKAVSSQVERVIQARGEMERTNSKMTLDIRQVLTRSQWVQLQAETQPTVITTFGVRGRGAQQIVPATR